jgi:tetratricopeptide (TPR) repeat protein
MSFSKANELKKAEKLVQQGKIAAAIKEYSMLVAANPNDVTLINTLGDLCVREGRIEEAILNFTKIGESYSKNGFTLKAIAMYKKIYKLSPANLDVALKLAELYAKQGLAMDARKQYMEVADQLTRTGRTQQALDILRRVADLDPENVPVRLKLAESYVRERLTDQAVEAYIAAGTQLIRKANLPEAQQAFQRVLEISPYNKPALNSLATIFIKQGDTPRAVALLTDAANANPDDPDLMVLMGRTFLQAELLDESEQAFMKLLEVDKSRFEYLLQLARKFVDIGQHDRAVGIVETCTDIMIARRQETRGVELLLSVTEFDPYHVRARQCLVNIYARMNETNELANALNDLADAALQNNDRVTAEKALRQLAELEPNEPNHRQRMLALGFADPISPTIAERDRLVQTAPLSPGIGQRVDFEFAADAPQPSGGFAPPPGDFGYTSGTGFAPVAPSGFSVEPPPFAPTGFGAESPNFGSGFGSPGGGFGTTSGGFAPPAPPAGGGFGGFNEFQPAGGGFGGFAPPTPPASAGADIQKILSDADRFANLGMADKAVELIEEAVAKAPESVEARLRLKQMYLDGGLIEKAAAQATALADLYERLGDSGQAQRFRTEAYSLNPNQRLNDFGMSGSTFSMPPSSGSVGSEVEIDINGAPSGNFQPAPPSFGGGFGSTSGGFAPPPQAFVPPPSPEDFYTGPPPHITGPPTGFEPVFDVGANLNSEAQQQMFAPPPIQEFGAEAPQTGVQSELKLREELEGVDFFLSQGYNDVARDTLARLSLNYPNHPEVLSRLDRLHRQTSGAPTFTPTAGNETDLTGALMGGGGSAFAGIPEVPVSEPTSEGTLLSGLVSDLEKALEELELGMFDAPEVAKLAGTAPAAPVVEKIPTGPLPPTPAPVPAKADSKSNLFAGLEESGLQDVFDEFKQSIEDEGEEKPDFETHYNLGLAYKDMELFDDAVEEFQMAFRGTDMNASDGHYFQVCNMLGLCFMSKGEPQLAAVWFKRGVEAPGRSEDEYQAMRYDLALAYDEQGRHDAALEMFETVYAVDINYREVAEKVHELREKAKQ